VARRMLRPIRTVAAVADAVARGDLTARATVGGPREVADIAAEVNRMLDRRQRDELALRDSEARFRQLFETSSDAILIVDRDGRIVFANAAIERVLGHKPAALAASELAMLQPERFRGIHRRAMRRFLASGTDSLDWRAKEFTGLHADGHEVPLEVAVSFLRTGSTDVFAAFLRDISARKLAEAELHESEARFRLLADSAPTLIWMADARGGCVYVNRRWTEFTAQAPPQACGDGWMAAVHPDDRQAVLDHNAQALASREAFSIEYRLRRHDGEYRWMLNSGVPRLAGDGALIGYIGSCLDIHERIGAERRILRLQTLYSALSRANEAMARTRGTVALLQQVCDIAVVHGRFHVVSIGLVDEQAQCLRTVAVAGETHEYFDRLVLPLAADEACPAAPSLIAFREDRPYISNDRERDPRAIPIRNPAARSAIRSTAALPLHREGRVSGCLTVHSSELDYFDAEMVELLELLAADLSFALDTMAADRRREQAESELRKLNATLEQKVEERTLSLQAANRELEAFSYSMSHDLRAPLRAINGFTELIAEGHLQNLDHEARGYLERIRAASQRMARLIDDLMNLCRIAQMELVREPLDLSRLAAEVIAELQEGEPQRAVQVRIAPGIVVEADRGLTQIALANLLGNAWKFTARRERPAIAFGVSKHEGRDCYFVRDNGAGFDMRHADKLFAPFQRLHADHEFAGTGIGLSLVQRIVQRHGGVVSAQSVEGEGTTIHFTLNP
ncbi:MAG: PAS domain S-box protein, partial [Casimicrobiaceae bacterium]